MKSIRLVVAEDDLLVREGVTTLLRTQTDFRIAGTAHDYDTLVEAVDRERPEVVLTDIRMPPSHTDEGIRAARMISQTYPGTGVVVLSQYEDPTYAIALLEHGSDGRGYLLKERVTDVTHLTGAIRDVARGGSHIDPKVVERLVRERTRRQATLNWLTPRELEVLSEIAHGKDNPAIANTLSINVRSVEKHINSIFAKLGLTEVVGVNPRVAAVLMYLGD